MMTLRLSIPPTVNNLYATVRGRRVLSRAARAYKQEVAIAILEQHVSDAFIASLDHGMGLVIYAYFPTPRKRDLDGILKVLQDAICEALGINDNRVDYIELYRRTDAAFPRVEATISLL